MRAGAALVAAACFLGLGVLLASCGGSAGPRPDLLLVSTRDGDYALYEMNADGGRQQRVTKETGDSSSPNGVFFQLDPAWAPDARRIAFSSRRSGSFDIYVMNRDGTAVTRLTSTRDQDMHPSWSPDGSRIAFARAGPSHVFVMKADGSGVRRLTDDQAEEYEPAWSPDGRWIAYARRTPGTEVREVWLARPDGSRRHRLTKLGAASYTPAWSADGRQVAFAANGDGPQFDIYTIGVDGTGLRRVTVSPDDSFEPAWSPNGKEIAYSEGGAIFAIELGPDGRVHRLTDPSNNDSSPAWNPVLPEGASD